MGLQQERWEKCQEDGGSHGRGHNEDFKALTLYQQMQNRHSKTPCDVIPEIKKVKANCYRTQASVCSQN